MKSLMILAFGLGVAFMIVLAIGAVADAVLARLSVAVAL